MAKAKSGGTRSFLRGRIASDVYSIGVDSKGVKQQIVRARPESVKNPNSRAQVISRLLLKNVGLASRVMVQIVNHSFEGVPFGTLSMQEFQRLNLAAMRMDFDKHFSEGYGFAYPSPNTTGMLRGDWIISKGSLSLPSIVVFNAAEGDDESEEEVTPCSLAFDLKSLVPAGLEVGATANITYGQLRRLLGLSADDYFTLVQFVLDANFEYVRPLYSRFFLRSDISDSEVVFVYTRAADRGSLAFAGGGVVTSFVGDNGLFRLESNHPFVAGAFANPYAAFTLSFAPLTSGSEFYSTLSGAIVSAFQDGMWRRSTCVLSHAGTLYGNSPEDALSSWPIGVSRFLNGGPLE